MAKLKFPDPGECRQMDKALMCPADRVIGLYNQETGKNAKRIGKTSRSWFTDEAHDHGWGHVRETGWLAARSWLLACSSAGYRQCPSYRYAEDTGSDRGRG